MLGVKESRPAPVRHPWRDWFKLGSFTLSQGVHYEGRTDTMAQQVRNAATRLGVRVTIEIHNDLRGMSVWVVQGE
jgi:hypothetical protein